METTQLTVSLTTKALSSGEFEGMGSVFGNVDHGGDIVLPGAFGKTLAQHKREGQLPQMFWMHQPDQVPGKWLEMNETEKGLYVKGVLADTTLGRDLKELVNMGAVQGLSIGYRATDVDYDKDGNRLLKSVDLWETSLVSLPMNPLAQVMGSKAAGEMPVPQIRAFERHLRDVEGCSKKDAKTLISRLFGSLPDVDAPTDEAAEIRKLTDRMIANQVRLNNE